MKDITAERLRELLDYRPDTGVFTWKIRTNNRVKVGNAAGSLNGRGYIQIQLDGSKHLAHRLAWMYIYGEWPPDQIDHLNGDKLDNRVANLRLATNSENKQNLRRPDRDNKVGYLGVSPNRGKFRAAIKVDGKGLHLGCFDTPEQAYAAYVDAKRKLHKFGTLR